MHFPTFIRRSRRTQSYWLEGSEGSCCIELEGNGPGSSGHNYLRNGILQPPDAPPSRRACLGERRTYGQLPALSDSRPRTRTPGCRLDRVMPSGRRHAVAASSTAAFLPTPGTRQDGTSLASAASVGIVSFGGRIGLLVDHWHRTEVKQCSASRA